MLKSLTSLLVIFSVTILGCSNATPPVTSSLDVSQQAPEEEETDKSNSGSRVKRPNILLIVADDLGYSDLGAFGGEIKTPNLDSLAEAGVKLTQFYASPTCSVTRSMLLSGVDSHLAGLGNMAELMQPNQAGKPGYEGYLNKRVVSIASLLQDSGYHTYMAGKWHLGLTEETSPRARGFERSFALLHGGSNHFDNRGVDTHSPVSGFRKDGQHLDTLPPSFDFSTNFYTRKLIDYIESNRGDGQPFFAYAAYTAPHWPLQAPPEYIQKYTGIYDAGYEVLRERRLQRLKALGLVADNVILPELPKGIRPWSSLTPTEKRIEARKMEIYAAMIDNMDENVGKLIKYLKDIGEFENTFVFVMSDNGADAADVLEKPKFSKWISKFDNSYESMGSANSFVNYGRPWAHAVSVPFRLWKTYTTEGGIRVPAIMSYPDTRESGAVSNVVASVTDLFPTFLDIAGITHPGTSYKGRRVEPIKGNSLLPLLEDSQFVIHDRAHALGLEIIGRRSLRRGDWKLIRLSPPHGSDHWELYNIAEDPGELNNLATKEPQMLKELLAEWKRYETENGLVYAVKSPL